MIKVLNKYYQNYFENKFLKSLRPLSQYSKVIYRPDMGRGVELLEDLKAGSLLGIYPGSHKSLKEFLEKEEFIAKSVKSAYLLKDNEIIDPTDIFGFVPDQPEYRIALINEPSEEDDINVIAVSSNQHVWYLAISDIKAGQQLFTTYGDTYERNYKAKSLDFKGRHIESIKAIANNYIWLKSPLKLFLEDKT